MQLITNKVGIIVWSNELIVVTGIKKLVNEIYHSEINKSQ